MNARQVVFAKVAVAALALLAAAGAAADVTLSVVDATPTARHDGTLPGIGETIFSADVHVEVTPDEAWWAGAVIGGTAFQPGVRLYRVTDPNTGEFVLTAPGYGSDAREFATFVNVPAPQLAPARFGRARAANAFLGFMGPGPTFTETGIDVFYTETPLGDHESGYTQRITIDVTDSAFAGLPVYVSTSGALDPRDTVLGSFISYAYQPDLSGPVGQGWEFYARVPEPTTLVSVLWAVIVGACWRGGARRESSAARRQPAVARSCALVLFLPAVGVLLSQAAIADHIVNLELLDRAVFVDIPGDRAVIDVSVTLATDEDWEAAGLFGFTTHSSVSFVYARDPNTGAAFLTRPNRDGGGLTVDEEFVTFVSLPRGQSALARFGANGEPSIAAGYLGPSPVATVGIVDVGYFDPDLSTPEPAGYFQRIAIELAPGSFDPLDLYFSTSGPSDPGHIRVAHMISAAFLADADSHFHEEITWEIFAIPEPSMFALALLGAPFVVRRRARLWKRLTCVLMIGGSAAALGTAATTVVIGPQVRVDQGGVGQGDETSISATNVDPNVGRRRGQRLSRPTNRAGA